MADPTSLSASLGARKVNIEDVKVGDRVLSQSESGERSVSTVTKLDQPIRDHMCQLDFSDGGSLKLTREHPLMTDSGWKSISPSMTAEENPNLIVGTLQKGDKVVREQGEGTLTDIACWSQKTQAYNLILDGGAHTYFADGYLAHNKGGSATYGNTCPPGYVKTCPTTNYVCDTAAQIACGVTGTWTQIITNPTPTGIGVIPYVTDPYGGVSMTGCNCGWHYNEVINGSEWSCLGGYTMCYACSCIQVCSAVAPSAPTLSSPANGSNLATTNVTLIWNAPTSWGNSCSSTNNQFGVAVGTSNPPTSPIAIVDGNTTSTTFVGVVGTTYYWYVRATNGQISTDSPTRSFTILDDQIAGSVFYDANNNCGGSGMSGMTVTGDSGALSAVTGATGAYTLTAATGTTHTLAVSIPAGYGCSTAAGCNTCSRSGIQSPSANNNFYLTDLHTAIGIGDNKSVNNFYPNRSSRQTSARL